MHAPHRVERFGRNFALARPVASANVPFELFQVLDIAAEVAHYPAASGFSRLRAR
jgi:hypothetical protein